MENTTLAMVDTVTDVVNTIVSNMIAASPGITREELLAKELNTDAKQTINGLLSGLLHATIPSGQYVVNRLVDFYTELPGTVRPLAVAEEQNTIEALEKPVLFNEQLLRGFAELMDPVNLEFIDRGRDPELQTNGYRILSKHDTIATTLLKYFPDKNGNVMRIPTETTVRIAKDITFPQMIALLQTLDKEMGVQRVYPLDNVQRYLRYTIGYLEQNATPVNQQLATGLRRLLDIGNEAIVLNDHQKELLFSWLHMDEQTLQKLSITEMQNKLLAVIVYEMKTPYRELQAFLQERGGRILENIDNVYEKGKLKETIQKKWEELQGSPDRDAAFIEFVQNRVGEYYAPYTSPFVADNFNLEKAKETLADGSRISEFILKNAGCTRETVSSLSRESLARAFNAALDDPLLDKKLGKASFPSA
jgi:hypothetical protein